MSNELPRTIPVCTLCWKGIEYDTVLQPAGSELLVLYRCKECQQTINPKLLLLVTQLRGRFGDVVGRFCSNEKIECPACSTMVQFRTDDCRKAEMECPHCGVCEDRVKLGVFHLFDLDAT